MDEAEQGEFAGLEEPFAIVHKATLHVIRQERDEDARPRSRARRSAQQLSIYVSQATYSVSNVSRSA